MKMNEVNYNFQWKEIINYDVKKDKSQKNVADHIILSIERSKQQN